MKKILLSLVAMMIATVSFAQSSLLATLSHNGTISTFYGTTALKEALAKADHGDAITLSAGQFETGYIYKAITLRGAGMSVNTDSINAHESTILSGDFSIAIGDTVPERLVMEGIYHTGKISYLKPLSNAMFLKCRFGSIADGAHNECIMKNCTFIHCRIADSFRLYSNSNAYMINCVVFSPTNSGKTASNFQFDNCVISWPKAGTINNPSAADVINSYYKNCVIMQGTSDRTNRIPSSNVAYKCVGAAFANPFDNLISKNNTNTFIGSSVESIFGENTMTYSDSNRYELTDEAKTKYLGTDNKEVGIHGGNLPYEEDPTTPQITKCNVAAKSTADGKLSVDIEVKAAEY